MKKKNRISHLAKLTLITQTILTLGLNWLFFLMNYRAHKASVNVLRIAKKKELNHTNFLDVLSIFLFSVYVLIMLVVVRLGSYFIFEPLQNHWVSFNDLFTWILILIVYILITLIVSYLFRVLTIHLHKQIYSTQYRNQNFQYDAFFENTKGEMILLNIFTLGVFYIFYLLYLGLYEVYHYVLNRQMNQKYIFTTRGTIGLGLIGILYGSTLFYFLFNLLFLNKISGYLMFMALINPLLGFGLYEFKMRRWLNNDLSILKRELNIKKSKFSFKIFYSICLLILLVSISQTIYSSLQNESFKHSKPIRIKQDEVSCALNEKFCLPTAYLKSKPTSDLIDKRENPTLQEEVRNYLYYYHNGDQIDPAPIHYINGGFQKIYSSEPVLYQEHLKNKYEEADQFRSKYFYLSVQTFYIKWDKDRYVPAFNLIKTIDFEVVNLDQKFYVELNNNPVYLYSFVTNELKEYDEAYTNIDTTRLIIDEMTLTTNDQVEKIGNSYKSVHVAPDSKALSQGLLSHFNPLWFDELFDKSYYLSKVGYPNYFDILSAKVGLTQMDHISYPYDRYYLLLKTSDYLALNDTSSNDNDQIMTTTKETSIPRSEAEARDAANSCSIKKNKCLVKEDNQFYNYLMGFDSYRVEISDFYTLSDEQMEEGQLSFEIKSIQQYFKHEILVEESLKLNHE
jgi:cell division protein FtsL